jgi:hypothetical protein
LVQDGGKAASVGQVAAGDRVTKDLLGLVPGDLGLAQDVGLSVLSSAASAIRCSEVRVPSLARRSSIVAVRHVLASSATVENRSARMRSEAASAAAVAQCPASLQASVELHEDLGVDFGGGQRVDVGRI